MKNHNKANIVTALFDIGRDKMGDGRSIEQYLEWFSRTLEINSPMVIYTEEKFRKFVEQRRDPNITEIIVQDLKEIPAYKYRNRIAEIIKDPAYLSRIKDNGRIECKLDLYNVIQYSKFGWLKSAIEKGDPNEFYLWMDAGCSRFFGNFDTSKKWPIIKNFHKDKLLIQGNVNTNSIYPGMVPELYKWESDCILVGTLFGGYGDTVLKISDMVMEIMESDMLEDNTVNNEQIALGMLYKRIPSLFSVYVNLNGEHLPLFNELSIK